jgi:hypothetical protein
LHGSSLSHKCTDGELCPSFAPLAVVGEHGDRREQCMRRTQATQGSAQAHPHTSRCGGAPPWCSPPGTQMTRVPYTCMHASNLHGAKSSPPVHGQRQRLKNPQSSRASAASVIL